MMGGGILLFLTLLACFRHDYCVLTARNQYATRTHAIVIIVEEGWVGTLGILLPYARRGALFFRLV